MPLPGPGPLTPPEPEDKVGDAMEARAERIRHHLRRPVPGRRRAIGVLLTSAAPPSSRKKSSPAASACREVTSDATTGGQLIVQALEDAGVRHCFGVPGESFLGVLDALYDSSITMVSTRHEGGGSFAATGYARSERGDRLSASEPGPVGTANMAIGVHNARQDSLPMIALAGEVNRSLRGTRGVPGDRPGRRDDTAGQMGGPDPRG